MKDTGHVWGRHDLMFRMGEFEMEQRFAEKNSRWLPGKLCVYVGMTGLTPEERLQKHLRGEKDAWSVRKYGQRLRPDL